MTRVRALARGTFRSIESRNFRLFFGGQLISQIGNWLTLIAQTLLVLKLTHSGVAIGALAAAQFGPVLLLGPWGGVVADRSDKRRLLMIVQSIAMLQSFTLAVLAFQHHPPVAAIFVVAFVGGTTLAFDNPTRRSFVVEMVDEEHVNNAVSLNSALMTASRIFGPMAAGLLIRTVGYGWCFLVDGISYIAVLIGLGLMRTSELRRAPAMAKAKRQVRDGLAYARRVPEIFVPMAMMAVIGTLSYNFQTVFPLFVERDLGGTELTYTVLFTAVSVGAFVGALIAANRTRISVRSVAWAGVGYGAALGVMTFAPNQPVAFALAPALGLASIAFLTASTAIVQIAAEPAMRGRVLALQAMLFLGTTPIGGPIVGALSQRFGARYGIAVGAVAAVVAGAWGLTRARDTIRPLDAPVADAAVQEAVSDLAGDAATAAGLARAG